MRISGSTPVYALLGQPVAQSLSPLLHNGWIKAHGFDAVYVALPIAPEGFQAAFAGLQAAGVQGGNVTSPFKEAAAGLVVTASPHAKTIGSVNSLRLTPHGYAGDSTDGAGLIADLDARAPDWRAMPGPITILGAGGAARAIVTALAQAGKTQLRLVNRTLARAQACAALVPQADVSCHAWSDRDQALAGASLVIHTTRAGLNGQEPLELDVRGTQPDCLIYETIYAPSQTALLKSAHAQGRRGLNGLGMLVGQGALAFELWFGTRPDFQQGLGLLQAHLEGRTSP
jgi:shikimate dehydrogenase